MIEFLNTLVFSMDGVYGVRVIHLILLALTIPMLPTTIKEIKEIFTDDYTRGIRPNLECIESRCRY